MSSNTPLGKAGAVAVSPQSGNADAESPQSGTSGPVKTCISDETQNGPHKMYTEIQEEHDAMVKRQVQENLRRVYDAGLPDQTGDRFALLLDRLRDKQAGRARRH